MSSIELRQSLLTRLGRFPEHVPLEPIFSGSIGEGDYTRVALTYMVEPGERIPAWLLIPKGDAPQGGWPATLAIHQHAGQFELGKSEPAGVAGDPMYFYGQELCRRGYVVLCPDQLCFEDRRPSEEERLAHYALNGMNYERFEFTKRLLSGSNLQAKYLHDLSCGLDLLSSLPDVNRSRLGAIGHSLGGQETLWFTWYDERVRAAVSSCGFGLLRTILRDNINHNFAAYIPGMLEIGDMDVLVASLAPRPFMLTAGEQDPLFPIDGVRALAEHAQQTYSQAGVPDHFQALIFPAGHSFPSNVKAEAYAFLDRWLQNT